MLTLHIRLISKPEMTMREAKEHIARYFPGIDADAFTLKADTESGIVSLTIHQDALTDEQRDWLHMTPFAARFIDSFNVVKAVRYFRLNFRNVMQAQQMVWAQQVQPSVFHTSAEGMDTSVWTEDGYAEVLFRQALDSLRIPYEEGNEQQVLAKGFGLE